MKISFPIAIVDDDDAVRQSLETMLRAFGNTVTSYRSGPAFLSKQMGQDLICVMLDLRMPGMSGHGVLECIRRFDRPVPVIVMTAHGSKESHSTILNDSIVDLLEKPFGPTRLFEALRKADMLLRLS